MIPPYTNNYLLFRPRSEFHVDLACVYLRIETVSIAFVSCFLTLLLSVYEFIWMIRSAKQLLSTNLASIVKQKDGYIQTDGFNEPLNKSMIVIVNS